MRKRIAIALCVAVALYTAAWFILAAQVQTRLVGLLQAQQAEGVTITTGTPSRSGYPFALRIEFPDFHARQADGLNLDAPVLLLGVRFIDWSHITIDAPVGVLLTTPDVKAAITTVKGNIDVAGLRLQSASLSLHAATVNSTIGTLTAGDISLHADWPDSPATAHDQPGLHLIANITDTLLPGPPIPALGNAIRRLTLEAVVMGNLSTFDKAALQAWSQNGGTLEVREFSADWGKLGLGMGGTAALDSNLQPIGSFNANITGFAEVLTGLADAHAIKPANAALLSMGLGLLAKPQGPDNLPTLSVPLTVQEGTVYVASFKLMRLPPIHLQP